MNHHVAPLWETIQKHISEEVIPYHMPGHKQGRGIDKDFVSAVGTDIFQIDLTEIEGLDNLHCPQGVIKEAQRYAADAFGAKSTYFLVNGATAGIEALLMQFGLRDKVLIPRNMHRSVLNGLILSGAQPVYVWPEYNQELGMVLPVKLADTQALLKDELSIAGVLMVNPTYQGVSVNINRYITSIREYQVPVFVDEAHGVHFPFHPGLPDSALTAGADACVHGAHKLMGALTQTAFLHVLGEGLAEDKIQSALQLLQSTSPSYILMASLDVARRQMAVNGKALLDRALEIAHYLLNEINKIPGFEVLTEERIRQYGDFSLDVTKVNLNIKGLSLTGFQVSQILREKYKIQAEMADYDNVLFMVTIGDTMENAEILVRSLKEIAFDYQGEPRGKAVLDFMLPKTQVVMAPRSAWQSKSRNVPLDEALGEVCAETLVPYPPGIPIIYPGEIINQEIITAVKRYSASGFFIQGAADHSLRTIKVIA